MSIEQIIAELENKLTEVEEQAKTFRDAISVLRATPTEASSSEDKPPKATEAAVAPTQAPKAHTTATAPTRVAVTGVLEAYDPKTFGAKVYPHIPSVRKDAISWRTIVLKAGVNIKSMTDYIAAQHWGYKAEYLFVRDVEAYIEHEGYKLNRIEKIAKNGAKSAHTLFYCSPPTEEGDAIRHRDEVLRSKAILDRDATGANEVGELAVV